MNPIPPAERQARAERVLRALQTTVNHDLPNNLVALQGLLHMLDLEEHERLGPAGRDYLRRLLALAERVQGTVATLRAISKTAAGHGPPEDVDLAELLREAVAVARQQSPQARPVCHCRWRVPAVRAPRAAVQQCLREVLRLLTAGPGPDERHLYVASRAAPGGGVEVCWGDSAERLDGAAAAGTGEPDGGALGQDGRLQLLLVAELAASWGGSARASLPPGQGRWLSLHFPAPAAATPE